VLIHIVLPAILTFIMFTLGLGLTVADFSRVLKFPRAFSIGAFNQLIVIPVVAFIIAIAFRLPPELAVGLMILAFCPGGVVTNALARMANGNTALSVSLTAVISIVSIFTLPVLVAWAVDYFMGAAAPPINVAKLGIQMFVLTAVPVGLGMLVRRLAPGFVDKVATAMTRIAFVLFAILIVFALIGNWGVFIDNFPVLGPALIILNASLLLIGVLTSKAAGLGVVDSTTVAIESGIQNGTLGIAVGLLIAEQASGLPPFTLPTAMYAITTWVASLPFVLWRRKITPSQQSPVTV